MTLVTGTFAEPGGAPASGRVTYHLADVRGRRLAAGYDAVAEESIVAETVLWLDEAGSYTVDLVPTSHIQPAQTRWVRTTRLMGEGRFHDSMSIQVPNAPGPEAGGAHIDVTLQVPDEGEVDDVDEVRPFVQTTPGQRSRLTTMLGEASSRRVYVQAWGGSVTGGEPGVADPLNDSWVGLMGAALRETYGDGGTGYLPLWMADTTSGTWTDSVGIAAARHVATGAAAKGFLDLEGTILRIYFHNASITGSFRYRIDGGSWTTVTTPNGFGLDPGRIEVTGLADTPHDVDIEWVSGTVSLCGVEMSRATGIVLQRCAIGGRGFSDYDSEWVRKATIGHTDASGTITATAPGHFTSSDVNRYIRAPGSSAISALAQITAVASATSATMSPAAAGTGSTEVWISGQPYQQEGWPAATRGNVFAPGLTDANPADLVVVGFGINDTAGYDLESAIRGLDRVLTGHREVVVVLEHHGAFDDTAGLAVPLRAMGAATALGYGGSVVDMWSYGRHDFTYADDTLGWFADPVHLNEAGNAALANDLLIPLLTP